MKRQTSITITGSEGLIGSTLCKYFKTKGRSVTKLDIKLGHDLTNERFVKKWFKENPTQNLINCFAIDDKIDSTVKKSDLFNFPLEKFSNYFNVNVLALFSVCREFARNSKNGTIINFSSTYGVVSPNPNLYENSTKDIAYGVTKAAVINLTKYLAVHLAPKIRVNTIVPGGIKFKQNKRFVNRYSKLTPMKRMMEKNELNELINYLSSKNSSYVTGSTIVCDGGYTIW
jgi:NAD(P)-dependent dehydrogenase (short-subunit alcohol dehydrogenase family)